MKCINNADKKTDKEEERELSVWNFISSFYRNSFRLPLVFALTVFPYLPIHCFYLSCLSFCFLHFRHLLECFMHMCTYTHARFLFTCYKGTLWAVERAEVHLLKHVTGEFLFLCHFPPLRTCPKWNFCHFSLQCGIQNKKSKHIFTRCCLAQKLPLFNCF